MKPKDFWTIVAFIFLTGGVIIGILTAMVACR